MRAADRVAQRRHHEYGVKSIECWTLTHERAQTRRNRAATRLCGRNHSRPLEGFLIQGVFMMILGLFAVALPHIPTLAIEIFVGWLFIIGGFFRVLAILRSRTAPGFWWSLLTAMVAIALGLVLIVQPLQGVLTLTLLLAVILVVEGLGAILISFEFRRHLRNWGWTLFKWNCRSRIGLSHLARLARHRRLGNRASGRDQTVLLRLGLDGDGSRSS